MSINSLVKIRGGITNEKIELTDELLNKEYLKKCSLNITEVREVLGIAKDKAQSMIKQIKKKIAFFIGKKVLFMD